MASLDKTSIKDEVNRLKADFDRFGTEGKVTPKSQAIMNSLFMIIKLTLALNPASPKNEAAIAALNSRNYYSALLIHGILMNLWLC